MEILYSSALIYKSYSKASKSKGWTRVDEFDHLKKDGAPRERLRCASNTITLGILAQFSHFRHLLYVA
jgi:hypothetical protein